MQGRAGGGDEQAEDGGGCSQGRSAEDAVSQRGARPGQGEARSGI